MELADTLRKIIHLIDETQYRCDVQRLKVEHVCEDYRNLMKKLVKKINIQITEEQVPNQNENIQQYSPDDKVDNLLVKAKKVKQKYKSSNTKTNDNKQSEVFSVKSSQKKSMVQVKQNRLQISNREFTATCASKSCDKVSQTVTSSQKSKQNITTAVLPRSKFVKLKTELQKSNENLNTVGFKPSVTCTTTERTVNKQMPNISKNISQSAKIGKSEIIVIPEIPKRLKRAVELNLQARSKAQSFWKKNNDYAGRFETKLLENMEIWEDENELREKL
ncbi:dynein heavy chain-like protein 2 [Centruroides vittatus]|uniref:dynein heavy chain-like protein 2 n=1 Tax=Centruroides vittatus TaxID=120091 RepID=UPI00350E9108